MRIASCKIYIFETKELKKEFIRTIVQEVTILIKGIKNIDKDILELILELNLRLVINFTLKKIRKNEQDCMTWLELIKDFTFYILNNISVNIHDKNIPAIL